MKKDSNDNVHALQIRIPQALYEKLKYAAKENHRTINAEVCMHLAQVDLPSLPSITGLGNNLSTPVIRPYDNSLDSLHGLISQYEDCIEGLVSNMADAQLNLLNQAAVAARLQRLLVRKRELPDSLLPIQEQVPRSTMDFHIPWKEERYSFEELLEMRNEQQRETERNLTEIAKSRLTAEKRWREVKEMMTKIGYRPPSSDEGE